MNARAQGGFTLLEIIAALALLALLMLGVYGGIRTLTGSVHRGRDAVARLDTRRGAEQFLRRNLAQVRPIPWARLDNGRAVVFVGASQAMRFVAPLPGFLGRLGPQLQTLKLVPDGHGQFNLEAAFALLPPDGSAPQPFGPPQRLLAHITSGQFAYRGFDIRRKDTGWSDNWTHSSRLPALVEIHLKTAQGTLPTLEVPLRVDNSAVNRAVIRATGLQAMQP
ncbi:MAG TPA: prepilin-type N-terminal cleavage/methylation domain-containing protein [Rhodanobacteraceae bacterium]